MSTKSVQVPAVSLEAFLEQATPAAKRSRVSPFADDIDRALASGLSYEQVAAWLKLNGVQISRQALNEWVLRRRRKQSAAPTPGFRSNPAPATAPSSDPAVSVAADGIQRINVRPTSAAFVPPTEGAADAEPEVTSGKRSDRHKPAKLF